MIKRKAGYLVYSNANEKRDEEEKMKEFKKNIRERAEPQTVVVKVEETQPSEPQTVVVKTQKVKGERYLELRE